MRPSKSGATEIRPKNCGKKSSRRVKFARQEIREGGPMRSLLGILLVAVSAAAVAQEGFPLDGTWRGEVAAAGENPATIVMVMQWDGKKVTGVINPGPKAI